MLACFSYISTHFRNLIYLITQVAQFITFLWKAGNASQTEPKNQERDNVSTLLSVVFQNSHQSINIELLCWLSYFSIAVKRHPDHGHF